MLALVYDNEIRVDAAWPDPRPLPGEALVKLRVAGICNTDLEITKGYMGFRGVLGHEFVGEVAEVADMADQDWVGRRVAGEINCACRGCPTCTGGLHTHCPHRTVLGILGRDGAFAQFVRLPIANLVEVPDAIPDEVATFAEPVAAAFQILELLHVKPTDRVAVIGDGKLGNLCAQVVALTGCELLVVGKHDAKLQLLRARGIPATRLDRLEADRSYDVVVEATGNPAGLETALQLLRPRGTLMLKSTYAEPFSFNPAPFVIDEIKILTSRCGPFAPALRALERGWVDPRPLISATYPLAQGVEAMAAAATKGTTKILLDGRA